MKTTEELKFEDALAKLEEAAEKLRGGGLSLEESAEVYRNSITYYNICAKLLEEAKQKIEIYKPESGETEAF